MMTVEQIAAEMVRKPDAHALVEWIADRLDGAGDAQPEIGRAIDAYFEGLED
jgi:hypothetical protein